MKTIYHVYEDSIKEGLKAAATNGLMIIMGSLSFALIAVLIRLGLFIASVI